MTTEAPPLVRESKQGAVLEVLAQPRASRNRVVGVHEGRLKLAIAAPPSDGAANKALISFLAREVGVGRSSVSIVKGQTSRRKSVAFRGLRAEELERALGL